MRQITIIFILTLMALASFSSCKKGKRPKVDFEYNFRACDYPIAVHFTNLSKDYEDVLWSFGDGTSATDIHPIHYYEAPGMYVVKLTAYNQERLKEEEILINLSENSYEPIAEFTINNLNNSAIDDNVFLAPCRLELINYSRYYTDFAWDFPNGQNSIDHNFELDFSTPVESTISLNASCENKNAMATFDFVVKQPELSFDVVRLVEIPTNMEGIVPANVFFSIFDENGWEVAYGESISVADANSAVNVTWDTILTEGFIGYTPSEYFDLDDMETQYTIVFVCETPTGVFETAYNFEGEDFVPSSPDEAFNSGFGYSFNALNFELDFRWR